MTYLAPIRKLYNLPATETYGFGESELAALEHQLNAPIPPALRNYYATLGWHEEVNRSFNRLLAPQQEAWQSADGYLIFYEENQGVAYWGIRVADLHLLDPPVYGNYNPAGPPDWLPESATTEGFLLAMALWNGTLGGLRHHANSLAPPPPAAVAHVARHWTELPNPTAQQQRLFSNGFEEVIILSTDANHAATGIFIGSSHRARFDRLLSELAVQWDYSSDEDEDDTEADPD